MVALLDSAVAAPSLVIPAFGRVKVIHGPNDEMFSNLVGISVAAVRHLLAEPFNIPADAVAFVNGERVGSLYRLQANETLEFVREWGRKGSGDDDRPSDRSAPEPALLLAEALKVWQTISEDIRRIADRLDPAPPAKVGTEYVARKLGCSTQWITELIRQGEIPANCIVPGTGNGKPWKFHRIHIDRWIESR